MPQKHLYSPFPSCSLKIDGNDYEIIINQKAKNTFIARIPTFPSLKAVCNTYEDARKNIIKKLRQKLESRSVHHKKSSAHKTKIPLKKEIPLIPCFYSKNYPVDYFEKNFNLGKEHASWLSTCFHLCRPPSKDYLSRTHLIKLFNDEYSSHFFADHLSSDKLLLTSLIGKILKPNPLSERLLKIETYYPRKTYYEVDIFYLSQRKPWMNAKEIEFEVEYDIAEWEYSVCENLQKIFSIFEVNKSKFNILQFSLIESHLLATVPTSTNFPISSSRTERVIYSENWGHIHPRVLTSHFESNRRKH